MNDPELLATLRANHAEIEKVLEQVRADNERYRADSERTRADLVAMIAAQTKWVVGVVVAIGAISLALARFMFGP